MKPAYQQMEAFFTAHSASTLLLGTATSDYAAARCLSQNLLMASLTNGAQALEKYLKAFLLMTDPACRAEKHLHKLLDLTREVDKVAPSLSLLRFMPLVQRFNSHYLARYPDDKGGSQSMTTADMTELDELVITINENLPCPLAVKMRSGLYAEVTFAMTHTGAMSPKERWLKENNYSLLPLVCRIEQDQADVLKDIYP